MNGKIPENFIKIEKSDKVLSIIAIILFIIIILLFVLAAVVIVLGQGVATGWEGPPHYTLYAFEGAEKWVISVTSVDGIVPKSDLYVKITYSNGTQAMYKQLRTFISEVSVNGATYYDMTRNDLLDPGDYFTLDKAMYPSGTIFQLIYIKGFADSVTLL
jgi:hypothetical protein